MEQSLPTNYRAINCLYDGKQSKDPFCCDFSHIKYADYRDVYEPSEDSFLLIDGLQLDLQHIIENIKPQFIMEVGVGSGVVINSLAILLKEKQQNYFQFIATDINPKALEVAKKTAIQNKNQSLFDAVQMNLASNLLEKMDGKFDIIIFNPPYVVTSQKELEDAQIKQGIEASWAGGKNGIQVLLNFIPQAHQLLSVKGAFYLLLIEENIPVLKKLSKLFKISYVVKRECPGEKQIIVRLEKQLNNL